MNRAFYVSLFGLVAAAGASAFNLNLSYRNGNVNQFTDAYGNTSTLNTIAKMDSSDTVLAQLNNLVQAAEPTYTTSVGTEITGDIDVDRWAANNYGISDPNVFLGSEIQMRLNTTENIDNVRLVWLTSLADPAGNSAFHFFAGDRFYKYDAAQEVNQRNGNDYAYAMESNLGYGLTVGTNARVTTWEILVETTGTDVAFRGGVRYDYDVRIVAVPEPSAMLGLVVPFAFLAMRRRR